MHANTTPDTDALFVQLQPQARRDAADATAEPELEAGL